MFLVFVLLLEYMFFFLVFLLCLWSFGVFFYSRASCSSFSLLFPSVACFCLFFFYFGCEFFLLFCRRGEGVGFFLGERSVGISFVFFFSFFFLGGALCKGFFCFFFPSFFG